MNRHQVLLVFCILLPIGLTSAIPARAAEPPEPSREAIERVVRDYLMRHPELIIESLQAFEQRQRAEQAQRVSAAIRAHRDELLANPHAPVGGNPKGDVTVVEFFDYRCGYCKRAAPTMKRLVEQDRNIRVVYKEFPILGPESVFAARAALAARGQGKYVVFHDALMGAEEALNDESIMNIAAGVGLDTAQLRKDMDSAEIAAHVRRNLMLAQRLGVSGTPAFIIGDQLVPGAADLSSLQRLVAQARSQPR
jgi:protein-disulfide isomerase